MAGPSRKLIDLMGREPDWEGLANRTPNDEVTQPAAIAQGVEAPDLGEGLRAMLIMSGCTAKFVLNYWMITHGKTGYRTNVSTRNDFDEWRTALDFLGRKVNGQRFTRT